MRDWHQSRDKTNNQKEKFYVICLRPAVFDAASSVVVCHNHPSGDPTPSAEDLRITRLDHIILGDEGVTAPGFISLRDKGYVKFRD